MNPMAKEFKETGQTAFNSNRMPPAIKLIRQRQPIVCPPHVMSFANGCYNAEAMLSIPGTCAVDTRPWPPSGLASENHLTQQGLSTPSVQKWATGRPVLPELCIYPEPSKQAKHSGLLIVKIGLFSTDLQVKTDFWWVSKWCLFLWIYS